MHFANRQQFACFRERNRRKVGYSIFLFEQPAEVGPVNLVLGNLQVDQLAVDDYSQLGTNDVNLRLDLTPGKRLWFPTDDQDHPGWFSAINRFIHCWPYVEIDQDVATAR